MEKVAVLKRSLNVIAGAERRREKTKVTKNE